MGIKPIVIAVNSVSGGGKTTVANSLSAKLANSRTICFDDYHDTDKNIPDIDKWAAGGEDYDLWHMDGIVEDIEKLLAEAGESQNIDYIILDYPFGYKQKRIAGYINLSVYIDTPLDIALARRILRDVSLQTKVDDIIKELNGYLRSRASFRFANLINSGADLKIDGSLPVEVITNIILQKIEEIKH